MKIGIVGLGKMGSRIAEKLSEEGHEIIAWNRTPQSSDIFKVSPSVKDLIGELDKPKIIWVMVPHNVVDEVLNELKKYLGKGDIVIDGGNSFYKDTERRFEQFEKEEVRFLGIGVSGGIIARKNGYPLMAGGSKEGYDYIKPILDSLAKPNGGHEYFGTGGAGHFVKMVHNGVEYGMMQSIGEGLEVLEKSKYNFNLAKVARVWKKGTIVSSFLIDKISEQLDKDSSLSEFVGPITRGGEGDWTIEVAREEGLDPEVIDESVEFRKRSETDKKIQESFTARVINALRNAFGGHLVKK